MRGGREFVGWLRRFGTFVLCTTIRVRWGGVGRRGAFEGVGVAEGVCRRLGVRAGREVLLWSVFLWGVWVRGQIFNSGWMLVRIICTLQNLEPS